MLPPLNRLPAFEEVPYLTDEEFAARCHMYSQSGIRGCDDRFVAWELMVGILKNARLRDAAPPERLECDMERFMARVAARGKLLVRTHRQEKRWIRKMWKAEEARLREEGALRPSPSNLEAGSAVDPQTGEPYDFSDEGIDRHFAAERDYAENYESSGEEFTLGWDSSMEVFVFRSTEFGRFIAITGSNPARRTLVAVQQPEQAARYLADHPRLAWFYEVFPVPLIEFALIAHRKFEGRYVLLQYRPDWQPAMEANG